MSSTSVHDEWLSLIEISGPFLAIPVLKEVFPQGLEELDGSKRKRLRQAYEEWREVLETDDPQFLELHAAWIDEVLSRGLELDEDGKGNVLKRGDRVPASLHVTSPEHGVTLAPDFAVVDSGQGDKPLMLIQTYAADVDLEATMKHDGWAASPAERMVQLCRLTGCRIGLVTNGERWMLVDAPVGAVTTFASWYARIWSQEPITLQAFVDLLGIRRFFFDQSEQLPALFDRSLKHQDEVTDALGEQVRRAVEVLIQSLDKADLDRNRELLRDVAPAELYEAGLTVMMRLVFLLSAEERGLLLLGDERYEANYALSTLRMKLRTESEEILERRWDAWSRLLAIFRAVFGGVEHENLRLPALGGSLFDPDRFPFLEGRPKGSRWLFDPAKPLPIDNRTVLLLLEAIQQFQGRTLSYRALDVEQIGYVYEGLLERTVKRTEEVTLELDATKSAKTPWVKLAELESANLDGDDRLIELLLERTGSSTSRIRNDLAKPVDDELADRLLTACQGDLLLRNRIKPYAHLLRTDPWGYPLVYPKGAFIVTTGSDRRETGTHYTPKSLTETIVTETLTPIAYVGPAEGTPREQWVLKSPAELLELKICDPAMGSGAFLVQACRWLAERLVEAWSQVETAGRYLSVDGEVLDDGSGKEPLPRDAEARTVIARRLIAERCLYGVDLNPLAVELAKLSIWLVTLAKGRPFGFLDHNLRCGDSLLGIHRLDQLTELSMTPTGKGQQRLFGQNIERAVHEAIELRQRLRAMPMRDIHDVEAMARLDADARRKLELPERIADAFIGEVLIAAGNTNALDSEINTLSIQSEQAIAGDQGAGKTIFQRAKVALSIDLPAGKSDRRQFHWPLEFPEVFAREQSGFDAVVGNPPYYAGAWLSSLVGATYRSFLVMHIANGVTGLRGTADLCTYFILNIQRLVRLKGVFGLVVSSTVKEGDSKQVGLSQAAKMGATIFRATDTIKWPGAASVEVVLIWLINGSYAGQKYLDRSPVGDIPPALSYEAELPEPLELSANKGLICKGHELQGDGFKISSTVKDELIASDQKHKEIVFPLITGDWLNNATSPPDEYVINFEDRGLDQAKQFSGAFSIVEERVKPDRLKYVGNTSRDRHLRTYWWQFRGFRAELKQFSADHDTLLALSVVTKHLIFRFVDSRTVPTAATTCILSDSFSVFAQLQTSMHDVWARAFGSSLGETLRYIAGRCFKTYPLIGSRHDLDSSGQEFYKLREKISLSRNIGYTTLYNQFHDQDIQDSDIRNLREKQVKLDATVNRAFGWEDLDLGHGFHEVQYLPENDRVRFTISETARVEVLQRLSELNRQRYEEEVARGMHTDASPRTSSSAPRFVRANSATPAQPGFDFKGGAVATINGANSATAILDFLSARDGWHAKADVLAAISITDGQWSAAIADLIAGGRVERQGERRGARYRVKERI